MGWSVLIAALVLLFLLSAKKYLNRGRSSYQATGTSRKLLASELEIRAFGYRGPNRNPVILVHGFLGSKIFDDESGQELWGRFDPAGLPPEKYPLFAHPMEPGRPLDALRNRTSDRQTLDAASIHLIGINFPLAAYNRLTRILEKIGYAREGAEGEPATIYEFHYDWRRDLVENARRLHRYILDTRTQLLEARRRAGEPDGKEIRFDLIGHSMGGLVSRYFLMFGDDELPADGSIPRPNWRGCREVDKLFVIGTPNAGYLDTIVEMSNGLRMTPGAPLYPAGLIGTFPAYYFMLPETAGGEFCGESEPETPLDLFDPDVWQCFQLGLLNPAQDAVLIRLLPEAKTRQARYAVALDHLRKCLARARQFRAAVNQPVETNPGETEFCLFAGNTTLTGKRAIAMRNGTVKVTEYGAGDGKVLTSSCRFDRCFEPPYFASPIPWDKMFFVDATHMGILDNESFIANFRFQLLMNPTAAQKKAAAGKSDQAGSSTDTHFLAAANSPGA